MPSGSYESELGGRADGCHSDGASAASSAKSLVIGRFAVATTSERVQDCTERSRLFREDYAGPCFTRDARQRAFRLVISGQMTCSASRSAMRSSLSPSSSP